MLRIKRTTHEEIRRHAEETYPLECCGVLLGRFESDSAKAVTQALGCANLRADLAHDRYEIDPKELIRIQREGRERGEEIVGFYHSHPDHPAQWSLTDLAEAHWIGCSYVITSVKEGKAAETRAFELLGSGEEDKRLVEETIAATE